MKKFIAFATVLVAIFLETTYATTVTFSGVPSAREVDDASNIPLSPAGSLVLAGTFLTPSNPSFSLNSSLSLSANFAAASLAGGWKQFGLDTITSLPNTGVTSNLGISASSKVFGAITDNNLGATKANAFNNRDLYLWVFNASSINSATQMGVFRATTASTPWTFAPNAEGIGDQVTYSTAPAAASAIQAIAGFGSTTSGQLKLTNNFNMVAPIPEPSTAIFGLLCLAAGTLSRRRSN